MKKNFKKAYGVATRLLLVFATIVALCLLTVTVNKVTRTQFQLLMIYNRITTEESIRETNSSKAKELNGEIAKYYQTLADEADKNIKILTQKRYEIQNSSDPIIYWTSKNGFELSILGISILATIATFGFWAGWLKNLSKITLWEEMVFRNLMYAISTGLFMALYICANICQAFAKINKPYQKNKKRRRNKPY